MRLIYILLIAALFAGSMIYGYGENIKIQPDRMFKDFNFSSVQKVLKYGDKYYVLEVSNHRLLVFNGSFKQTGQISKIGQEKGEVYYPENFSIKNDIIYIVDGFDRAITRVQWFDLSGKYQGGFTLERINYGFDVDSKGNVFLGIPDNGKLISVYSMKGELLYSFGDLKKISSFYGSSFESQDDVYKKAINRIFMHIDKDDKVYASFLGAPYFQVYDKNYRLLFEKKIQCQEADMILGEFAKKKDSPVKTGLDNIPTPLITTGITTDPNTGNIILAFQWNTGWIYIADSKGDKITLLEPVDKSLLFTYITTSENSVLYLARLSVVKFNEAYYFNLKDVKSKIK